MVRGARRLRRWLRGPAGDYVAYGFATGGLLVLIAVLVLLLSR